MDRVTAHVLDFETTSGVNLKKVGAWRYSQDPSTEILCLSFETLQHNVVTWVPGATGSAPAVIMLRDMAADPEIVFVAHNAGFEKAIWRNIMVPVFGFPDIPNSRWDDTMAHCAQKGLPLDMDTALGILCLGEKDNEGSKLVIAMSRFKKDGSLYIPRTPENLQRAYTYCESDVGNERKLLDGVGGFQPGERNVWLLDQRINDRGIKLDMDYVRACRKIVAEASAPLGEEFKRITGGHTFGQVAKVRKWCEAQGVALPNLQKETIAELLGSDPDMDPDDISYNLDMELPANVRRALEIRQLIGSASIKKLEAMQNCVGFDGLAHGLLQYCGASSSKRWSGRLLQPQNFPRPTFKDEHGKLLEIEAIVSGLMTGDYRHVQATLGPAVEIVVNGLRHSLIARPGRRFVSGDFVGVELRGLMAHAGQWNVVKMLEEGLSPYVVMGEKIYGRPIDKKKDPYEYDIGKHSVLGQGYQMGGRTFHNRYARDQTLEFCDEVTQVYRKDFAPEVPKMWKGLEAAAMLAVWTKQPHSYRGCDFYLEGDFLVERLPSGSLLYFYKPTPIRKTMAWSTKEEPDVRQAWWFLAVKNGQVTRRDAFGGLLTGITTQAIARDLMVHAMFKLEKNGFPIVLTVHDEVLSEPLAADADEKAYEQIMSDRPQWAIDMRFPVKVDTWVGDRYRK